MKFKFKNKTILILVAIVFIFFLLNSVTSKIYRKNKTVFPTYTTYVNSIAAKGFNVFNEKTYKASGNGIVLFNASEGQKVPVDYEIASINLMNDTSDLKDELTKVNAALNFKLKEEGKTPITNGSVNVYNIQDDLKNDNFTQAILDINELDINTQKNVSISTLTELMSYTSEELMEKKDTLAFQIAQSNISYKSEFAGIVSFKIDGLEDYYNFENIDKIDTAYLNKYNKLSEHLSKTKVEKGENLFKVIDNLSFYIALRIKDFKDIDDFKIGDILSLQSDNGTRFSGEIYKIKKNKSNGVVIINVNDCFEEIYPERINDFKIILDENKCFEIPKSAIIKRNNISGVFIQEIHGLVRFVPIELIESFEDTVYVSSGDKTGNITISDKTHKTITINDSIVINPMQIDESQILN
ncbi:HlyD family efflux transporter periplasmic adaptor subunit [Anaerosphaera multitolerans]|uniref:HlyD family efflux transporter periplasmic adaptor subunit n=1 Tax=Anaerosphaera multitolerans TaxID=2487351 RepID=UPI001F0BFEEC|nr:HlyD family efflux transporter periplasmic adaptor subunit [Anaerosphaera multitolerans]